MVLLIIGGIGLQTIGPAAPPVTAPSPPIGPIVHSDPLPAPQVPPDVKPPNVAKAQPQPLRPGRSTPGPVADPDPALLEPYGRDPKLKLPRISADGRAPMAVYAAGFDPTTLRPRVGILIAGIGMSEADSLTAIKTLPGGITLAVSPSAGDISHLLAVARLNEHEYLLSVPMEPRGYPANDPDDRLALMTSLPPAENLKRLRAVLARVTGYVGVTNALGPMRGERLVGMADQIDAVLEEIAGRGLLFVDARTGQPSVGRAWNRSADIILDVDPVDAAALDQRLDALSKMALDKGSALGIVSIPRPVVMDRVLAWTNTLVSRGLTLAPVSALMQPPAKQGSEK